MMEVRGETQHDMLVKPFWVMASHGYTSLPIPIRVYSINVSVLRRVSANLTHGVYVTDSL